MRARAEPEPTACQRIGSGSLAMTAVTGPKVFEGNGHWFGHFQVGYDEDATCYEYATANLGDWDVTHTGGSNSKIRVCGPKVQFERTRATCHVTMTCTVPSVSVRSHLAISKESATRCAAQ